MNPNLCKKVVKLHRLYTVGLQVKQKHNDLNENHWHNSDQLFSYQMEVYSFICNSPIYFVQSGPNEIFTFFLGEVLHVHGKQLLFQWPT